ncbi:MAG: RdgB/HAM1 family non-canonical purine NTP pyrophosphatase [Fimbriimonadaceae bacterium]
MQVDKLVIATHNIKKGGEMVAILASALTETRILTLQDFPNAGEPEETGTTYQENATIKALSAAEDTGMPCLADDAGLEIDALGGEPGLYSKRFAGELTPFSDKMSIILHRLQGCTDRKARFRCCIALASHKPLPTPSLTGVDAHVNRHGDVYVLTIEATCEGVIAKEPSGNGGFGYDPIFFLPQLNCTMADLTSDQKHAISHRGKVLRALCLYLRQTPN